jgi:heme oxygenase (biliverdin-IX-beta and delta-forming)
VLAHLRAVTRPAHHALEGALGLLEEDIDLDKYKNVLARFYGFWSGWEPQVTMLLQDEALSKPRQRLHLLVSDLAALGISGDAIQALPRCPLTTLCDAMEALGSLYVMEGSTLGGRVIQRHVERRLGDDGLNSCSYFNGYGAKTGTMWRSFLARLDDVPVAAAERIGRGACATFERLGWWITRRER